MGGETGMCRMELDCISSVKLVFTDHMMHVCRLAIVFFSCFFSQQYHNVPR